MSAEHETIVIVGAGPAGCTLACLLGMRGRHVLVFDDDKRPELLVGESFLPSVIPILRKLELGVTFINQREPLLREKGANAKRVTDVMTYTNYQLIGNQGHGKGWLMLGDAFGFVDPMLSPGLFIAMESAMVLDQALFSNKPKGAEAYCKEVFAWHESWQELIDYFYSGGMMGLYEAGNAVAAQPSIFNPAKFMEKHVSRVIAAMASGTGTRSTYNRRLLAYSSKYLAWDVHDADFYAVK